MNKKRTILHIVISLETGGLEKFVIDLVHFTSDIFNHKIVCLERTGVLGASSHMIDVICLNMKPGLRPKGIFQICSIIRNNNIDIIHTHNEKAQFYGAIAGFLSRVPLVHTKHGKSSDTLKSLIQNNIFSYLYRKIIAVSHDAAMQCISEEKIPASKVMTILNGVNVDLFSHARCPELIRSSLGIGKSTLVIGIVARLAKVKDHATLFAACQILKQSNLDFKLLIVGDGPLMDDLVTRSSALGLHDHIIFTGARFDIPDLLCTMDVFVLSSISEGISLTLIEAMASELPIVATDVGGNSEVVVSGETGFLVPAKEPAQMAERILQLLVDSPLRKEFGRRGRLRANECFSINRAANQYEALYYSVLGNR